MTDAALPLVIQGGMGVAVSSWRLARAVSAAGQLGVVSGTGLDTVLVRRLQNGDRDGAMQHALEHLPLPGVASGLLRRYYRRDGRAPGERFRTLPMYKQAVSTVREQVTVAANFAEVFLAKEGHGGRVGINLLTKVQMPTLASLYGAMLAGVDVVLMGAGIPREIPGVLDALALREPASLRFDVVGQPSDQPLFLRFNPAEFGDGTEPLRRPDFYAIVAAHTLALTLSRKATGRIDGYVVEGASAGGHNAPPRGPLRLSDRGEAGIQVGTAFAYADESGMAPDIKRAVLAAVATGRVSIFTDPLASPTGFPFKIVQTPALTQQDDSRERRCDLGYLRTAVRRPDARLAYRCSAAPVAEYVAAGGAADETVGRKCLCNGLMATIGLGQLRANGIVEPPLVTSGNIVTELAALARGRLSYTAHDVLEFLLNDTLTPAVRPLGVRL